MRHCLIFMLFIVMSACGGGEEPQAADSALGKMYLRIDGIG